MSLIIFKSKLPTVDASVLILFREFHDSSIFLLFVKKFLIKLNKKSADCNLKKDFYHVEENFYFGSFLSRSIAS